MADPVPDLNAVITSAVNARIEAEVTAALSGDAVIGQFVAKALQARIEVDRGNYRKEPMPYLTHVLEKAIQEATKAAVTRLLAEEVVAIEDAVRKALRRDLARIASTLTKSLSDAAARTYGVDVHLDLKMPIRD